MHDEYIGRCESKSLLNIRIFLFEVIKVAVTMTMLETLGHDASNDAHHVP